MNFKIKLTLIMILLLNVSLFAQNSYALTGVVSDANNEPLIGVNVSVESSSSGAITDIDGRYSINVKDGDVVNFSYIGYATQSVTIAGQKTLDITLSEDAEVLGEVVVVGYGTRKKSHNTGAIAQVGGKDIAGIQANRVDEALAGKLAGVLIQNQDGEPGADPKIQIRAASSISGDSDPLIVVDGYPISGSLATVNPNDIQSLEVLKDAASAAIYGSRGANGVILVTTKKGTSGKPSISYNAYVSTSSRYLRENINPTSGEWATIIDNNIADGTFDISEYVEDVGQDVVDYRINGFRNSPDVMAVEDWLFQNGNSMNHDISVSGGSEDVKYRLFKIVKKVPQLFVM